LVSSNKIVGTPAGVYQTECKWPRSSSYVPGGEFVLAPEQRLRHEIFRAYRNAWEVSGRWVDMVAVVEPELRRLGISPPRADTRLARILTTVLTRLESCGETITDVLLFLQPAAQPGCLPQSRCAGFTAVSLVCPVAIGDFVRL
jgi:hypothetical protein